MRKLPECITRAVIRSMNGDSIESKNGDFMEIVYDLMDPTGNKTILVETPVDEALQPALALKLLELEPSAEQVGYVTRTDDGIKLRMAGGEFCGNASMSTAVLYVMDGGMRDTASGVTDVTVYASGVSKPLRVKVEKKDGEYFGTVGMPVPNEICDIRYEYNGREWKLPTVVFDGITHIVMEEKMDGAEAEKAVRKWCRDIGADGLGLMMLDRANSKVTPLVYVENPETLYWESSCASGTTAVGTFLAEMEETDFSCDFTEPGGVLHIEVTADGHVQLRGRVRRIADKKRIDI